MKRAATESLLWRSRWVHEFRQLFLDASGLLARARDGRPPAQLSWKFVCFAVTSQELVHLNNKSGASSEGLLTPMPHSPSTPSHLDNEESIVSAAQAGDSDAFISLLNLYSRRVYRVALNMTGNHQDAEDVLQEASMNAYCAIAGFQGKSRFYSWLVRITINAALSKLRKRALWKESSLDEAMESEDGSYVPLEIESWCDDPEEACLNVELHQILADVIQKLDPKSRAVFTLRDVEKFSTEETADVLGISIPLVKTRLFRARLNLRERLTEYFGKEKRNAMQTSRR
jgi:RNA polymerase sigma-70 factor, ECF subfamily